MSTAGRKTHGALSACFLDPVQRSFVVPSPPRMQLAACLGAPATRECSGVVVGILIVGYKPHIHERKGILSHERGKSEECDHKGKRAAVPLHTCTSAYRDGCSLSNCVNVTTGPHPAPGPQPGVNNTPALCKPGAPSTNASPPFPSFPLPNPVLL